MSITTQRHLKAVFTVLLLVAAIPALGLESVEPYRVSPGDVLNVTVFGEAELSGRYPVGPTGAISMPLVGPVSVGGETLDEVELRISGALRRMIRRPNFTVGLDELESRRRVYVTGEVDRPGPQVLPFGATVADAVAAAGPTDYADLRGVRLTCADGRMTDANLAGLHTDEPLEARRRLRYGDTINVPTIEQRIAVLGQVNTPGESLLRLGERMTVLDALGRIGGGLQAGADRGAVMLLREGRSAQNIDLDRLLREGDLSENLPLAPGDVLVVRESDTASVLGEVRTPASFEVGGQPITALKLLARSGGVTDDARLDRAQILTLDGAVPIDLEGLLVRGEMEHNRAINPGEVLLVPRAGPETVLVIGAVQTPGVIDISDREQGDLLRLLAMARPCELADLEQVHVYREDGRRTVNMAAVMQGALDQNVALQPDDVVMVPELNTFYLLGATTLSGPQPLTDGLTLLDVVSRHGNFARAKMNEVTVIRTDETGEPQFIVRDMAHHEVAPEDMSLMEGDIVYIPQEPDPHFDWAEVRNALWSISSVWALLGHLF